MAVLIDSYSESNYGSELSLFDYTNGGLEYVGQSFSNQNAITLDNICFYLKKVGSPTGNARIMIYQHGGIYGTSSIPSGEPIAISDNLDVSSVNATYGVIPFNVSGSNRITLTALTKYIAVINYSAGDGGNHLTLGMASPANHSGNFCYRHDETKDWTPVASWDALFYVYGAEATYPPTPYSFLPE